MTKTFIQRQAVGQAKDVSGNLYTISKCQRITQAIGIGGNQAFFNGPAWFEANGLDIAPLSSRTAQIVATGVVLEQVGD